MRDSPRPTGGWASPSKRPITKAVWVDLRAEGLDRKILLRGDGTSMYITQDLGTAKLKYDDYRMDRSVYVVGSEQNRHFQVLFATLRKLGYPWAAGCRHLSHGMVYLPQGKLKSREGQVVDADNLMDEMHRLAYHEVRNRWPELTDEAAHARAESIGLGAMKFFILKFGAARDINYDPRESIAFEGETGPYVQYAHARVSSLLRKSPIRPDGDIDYSLLGNDAERELAGLLISFPETVLRSAEQFNPAILCKHLFTTAKTFARYWKEHRVIDEGNVPLTRARLALARATGQVLANGLRILGIDAPEEM
jgi:arginyl-tRNA synthetase